MAGNRWLYAGLAILMLLIAAALLPTVDEVPDQVD